MIKSFLQEVAEDLIERFGADLQDCAIIFNNKRPAAYLQKHLADVIGKPFFSPSIFTVQEFIAKASGSKIADFYLQFFTLHRIYNQLLHQEGLDRISGSKFFSIAKIILADFSQIDIDLVDAVRLYRDLEDISVINKDFDYLSPEQYEFLSQFWTSYSEGKHKKQQELFIRMWRRMPMLYQKFHAALADQGYVTSGLAYRKLAEGNAAENHFVNSFKGKLVFVGFNALSGAEARIFKDLQQAGRALFYFDSDPYYLDDILQEAGLFLRKNLNNLKLLNVFQGRRGMMHGEKHVANVYQVQGQTAQAKILNTILKEDDLSAAGPGSVAVVLADESLLIPALQTIPTVHDGKPVDLNVTMGLGLAASSVYGLADLWLLCQLEILKNGKVSFKNVETFLTHPLTGLSKVMRDKINGALLVEKEVEIDQTRLIRQKGLFEVFFAKAVKPDRLVSQLLEVMNFVLMRLSNGKRLKKIDAELFVKTIQELNRLHDTFGKHVDNEEITFVISLIQRALQGVAVPLSGDPLKGIQLMGLLETRNLNFEKIVFLGFNEGVVPKSIAGNSFIPDSIRRVYDLPVLENQDAISAYMVYRLVQRASEIHFVYNSLTDDSASGEPSRILKQLAYESGFEFHYHMLDLNIRTEPVKEVKIEKKGNKAVEDALDQYLSKRKTLSPSALTQYILNPVDFFFNYIAGIKEPKEITAVVEANEIGSILHKVMEYFYQDVTGQEITKELLAEKKKLISAFTQKAFAAVIYNDPARPVVFRGMQKVILAIVEAYVHIIVAQDESQAPFRIMSLERRVEADISFPLSGKEVSIRIGGIIDRVDMKDGITRIIDYKTGSDKLSYKDIPDLFNTDGKHINKALVQTLLYTYIYEQASGERAVEPNLYIVKTMNHDGVWFKSGKQNLYGSHLEEVKIEFLAALKEKLTELFEAPYFKVSLVEDNFKYSIYKTLFGKR